MEILNSRKECETKFNNIIFTHGFFWTSYFQSKKWIVHFVSPLTQKNILQKF
jgi:hypothetical protein